MWAFYKTTIQKARKQYRCDALEVIASAGYREEDFDPEDWAIIDSAYNDKGISPGTMYERTRGMYDGIWQTWKARLDVVDVCKKYGLLEE